MVELKQVTQSAEETEALGFFFGKMVKSNAVICLFGELGAGKTTFIRGLANAVTQRTCSELSSPTFTYLHIYEGALPLFHFDLYRLKGPEEFIAMGFDEYFFAGGICCVEWAERIAPIIPQNAISITLDHDGSESKRKIEVKDDRFFSGQI